MSRFRRIDPRSRFSRTASPLLVSMEALALTMLILSCGGSGNGFDGPVQVDLTGTPAPLLSDLRLISWDGEQLSMNERVIPYALNTPLFTDYAVKDRAIYVPEGTTIGFRADGALDFPVGTVLLKTFALPADFRSPTENVTIVETRLLIRYDDGWEAWPYIWNDEQTDARLTPAGDVREVDFINAAGETLTSSYLIPQRNQCQECHEIKDDRGDNFITPIGPSARNLHRDYDYGDGNANQLSHLEALGMLDGLPALGEITAAADWHSIEAEGHAGLDDDALNTAARDYLDVNCGHCHNPRAIHGITSQLFLNWDNEEEFNLGICKRPGSAGVGTGGFAHDIVPGDPDTSILVFRVETTEVGAMMPLIGRSLRHDRGAALLREWVARMPAMSCDPPM